LRPDPKENWHSIQEQRVEAGPAFPLLEESGERSSKSCQEVIIEVFFFLTF
jgi:hypothetical protein